MHVETIEQRRERLNREYIRRNEQNMRRKYWEEKGQRNGKRI